MEAQPCGKQRVTQGPRTPSHMWEPQGFLRQVPAWLHLAQDLNSDVTQEGRFPGPCQTLAEPLPLFSSHRFILITFVAAQYLHPR